MFRFRSAIALSGCLSAALAATGAVRADHFQEIVVFGDSTVDTGNLHIATDGQFAASPYFAGRFSNGPVWVEVLAGELGLSAPLPSLTGGANYAWAAAESGDGLSFFGTPNLGLQVDSFLDDRGQFSGDELIIIAVGANDLLWAPPYSPRQIARNIASQVTRLADVGGRAFLVATVAHYANSPLLSGPGQAVWFDALADEVNKLVDRELVDLEAQFQVDVVRIDIARLIDEILVDPGAFGLTNTTAPACPGCGLGLPEPDAADTLVPNPDEYLWWDLAHLTRVVHETIGALAAALVQ